MSITFRMAWRNLWRHSRRTWLTVGAMIFSNILLVFMISLQAGSYRMMIDNTLKSYTGHMQVQLDGYLDDQKMRSSIPDIRRLADELRSQLSRDTIAARGVAFAMVSSEQRSYGLQITGVEPAHEPGVSTLPGLIVEGSYFSGDDAAEMIIGSVLARNLQVSVGDELTLLGSGRDGSFAADIIRIRGIFDSGNQTIDRSMAQLPLAYFQHLFSMSGHGHNILINADDLDHANRLEMEVRDIITEHPDLRVHDWETLQPGLKQAIQADISSAFFMYATLVIIVSFSVLNTQLMSVIERTREFGIMMALGLRPGQLGRLVMTETALMSCLGLIIGCILGTLVAWYLSIHGLSYPGMEEMASRFNLPDRIYPGISPLTVFLGPGIVFVCSLIASLYPALRLSHMRPVEAMQAV